MHQRPWQQRWEENIDRLWEPWIRYRLSRPYPAKQTNETVGDYGERLAAIYLQRKGYFLLEKSFRTRYGEIDLIAAWRKRLIVFVEVKAWERLVTSGEGPSDRVDEKKQKKITDTAMRYVKQHRLWGTSGRADVIEIIVEGEKGPEIRHFENAFPAVGQFQMFS